MPGHEWTRSGGFGQRSPSEVKADQDRERAKDAAEKARASK